MGKEDEIGCLREGAPADVAFFDVILDNHLYEDFFGHRMRSKERLVPIMTPRKGNILQPAKRATETLDCLNRGNLWGNTEKGENAVRSAFMTPGGWKGDD